MNDSELIRKILDTVTDGSAGAQQLNEGVHIELDGPEADEFVERLMQLSGQHEIHAELPADPNMPTDMPIDSEHDIETAGNLVAPVSTDVDFSMDDGISNAAIDPIEDDECMECGMPESECSCEDSVEENTDFDFGNKQDCGEIDPHTYMWNPQITKQKLVKGVMGDNPMSDEPSEVMERFSKILDEYINFLSEGENEDGVASPLTADSRDEFDKDPFASEEATTDGSISPLSKIKLQDSKK